MSRRPTARRRARAGTDRRIRVAFRTAGALVLAGVLLLAAGRLTTAAALDLVVFMVSGLAAVAVAVGLLGVVTWLRRRGWRLAWVASALIVVGGIAALAVTVLTVVWRVEPLFYPRTFRMDIILDAWLMSMLVMLGALLVALIVVGLGVWRLGLGRPAAGPLLITGGLLTLVPPAISLAENVPVWLWLVLFGGWVVIFFALGSVFPSDSGSTEAENTGATEGPGSGLPKWFKVAVVGVGVTAGVIILLGGACFLILTLLALG